MIIVFAYAFPHRKTNDFLIELKLNGFDRVLVIAAPWKEIKNRTLDNLVRVNLTKPEPLDTVTICHHLRYDYAEIEHDNVLEISKLISVYPKRFAIISGARIIRKDVIEMFNYGILNFHPGKLPETAGLDSFFYTLAKNVPLGVTAHFINEKIDAGYEIFFEELAVNPLDSLEDLTNNLYYLQIRSLRKFLDAYKNKSINKNEIVRPSRNAPMSLTRKQQVLEKFEGWKDEIVIKQSGENLLKACINDNFVDVKKILYQYPSLIEYKNDNGWTPLIVAAFNQSTRCVNLLLSHGANPNAKNKNGTTVLMYAKTKLLDHKQPDFSIMTALIDAGSIIEEKDISGKSIIDYCRDNPIVSQYLKENLK